MKHLLFVLLFISGVAYGQPISSTQTGLPQRMPQSGHIFSRGYFDSALVVPKGITSLQGITGVSDTGSIRYNKSDSSIYVYTGSQFLRQGGSGSSGWGFTGNSGTAAGTNFIGTTDGQDLVLKRNSTEGLRLASGKTTVTGNLELSATSSSSTGVIYKGSDRFIHDFKLSGTSGDNLFIGKQAGNFTMTGSTGIQGSYNVAVGVAAMSNNTTGLRCTAVGTYAMQNNTTGVNNTAVGQNALATNTTGYNNAVVGGRAAAFGSPNDVAAVGLDAASRTNNAAYIAAVGTDALYNAYNSMYAVAIGDSTLWKDSVGVKNTAVGSRAGYYLGDTYPNFSTQHDNYMTFLGADASRDSSISNQTGLTNSTAIGYNAKVYASNQVSIGNDNITTTLLRGNVGIGTRTPSYPVHATATGISGSVTTGYFESVGATTTNTALRLKATNAVNNIALAVENGEGSVGIGTLTPAAVFHTVGTVRMASMGSASTDTTTYKPMGISSLGDVIPMASWYGSGGGGGGSPAGSNTQVQFNGTGAFAASANFTWSGTQMGVVSAVIGSTSTPNGTSPLTIDAASTNTTYLLQAGKNGNPAYFRIDKDGNITDIGGGPAPISSSGGKPYFSSGFAATGWNSAALGTVRINAASSTQYPWIIDSRSSTTDNQVGIVVTGSNATTKGDIQQWVDKDFTLLASVNSVGTFRARNVIYRTVNATDAGFTAANGTAYILPNAASADRTITLPGSPQDGDIIRFHLPLTPTFHWDFSGSVTLKNGSTYTRLDNYANSIQTIQYDGANSVWRLVENL